MSKSSIRILTFQGPQCEVLYQQGDRGQDIPPVNHQPWA